MRRCMTGSTGTARCTEASEDTGFHRHCMSNRWIEKNRAARPPWHAGVVRRVGKRCGGPVRVLWINTGGGAPGPWGAVCRANQAERVWVVDCGGLVPKGSGGECGGVC